jgi:hypothetical protein
LWLVMQYGLVQHGLHAQSWADTYAKLLRGPAVLGQELPVPEGADPQTRLLRTLGRAA